MPEKILTVEDLEIKFELRGKTLHAIRGISMELHRGEILAIVGESGSGKSVFTKSFMGLLDQNGHVTAGKATYYGADNKEPVELTSLKKEKEWLKIRGHEIAMIMQDPMTSLSPLKTIGVQIMEAVLLHQNVNRAEAKARTLQYLTDVGISEPEKRFGQYPHEFSGGMRQRAALIRTLALEPDLLLLDEPFSALDYQTRLSVCDDISSIIRSRKKTAILITHDLSEAVSAADRILVLTSRPGRIKGELLIRFPDHETSPLKRRNYPEFSSYFNELWRILGNSGEGDEMALDGNDRKYGGGPLKDENDGPKCGIGGGADEIS